MLGVGCINVYSILCKIFFIDLKWTIYTTEIIAWICAIFGYSIPMFCFVTWRTNVNQSKKQIHNLNVINSNQNDQQSHIDFSLNNDKTQIVR